MTEYDKLKQLVEDCASDVAKAGNSNRSAGTRVRKTMQDIKEQAQEVRQAILKLRDK